MQVKLSLLIIGFIESQTTQEVGPERCRNIAVGSLCAAQQTGAHSGAEPSSNTSFTCHSCQAQWRCYWWVPAARHPFFQNASQHHPEQEESAQAGCWVEERLAALSSPHAQTWSHSPTVRVSMRSGPCHRRQLRGDRHWIRFDGSHIRWIWTVTVKMNPFKYKQDCAAVRGWTQE